MNDACQFLGIPLVDASIFMFEGQVSVYQPDRPELGIEGGPCYRCLYPDPPPPGEVPSCAEAGVLGVLPGIVGSIQAIEAIKLLLGIGEPLIGKLLMIDTLDMSFRTLRVQRNHDCPVCGENPTVTELIDYEQFCGLPSRQQWRGGGGAAARRHCLRSDYRSRPGGFEQHARPAECSEKKRTDSMNLAGIAAPAPLNPRWTARAANDAFAAVGGVANCCDATTVELPAGAGGILSQVGNTPLLDLSPFVQRLGVSPSVGLFAKAEWLNAGGSVKSRAALRIIQEAIRGGELRAGKTIIDSSSGNTGIAFALIGASLGYPVHLVMPANVSDERKALAQAYGARLIESDPLEGSDGALRLVRELVQAEPDKYFYADQYNNPANWQAHFDGTGPEIWRQTHGRVTHFVAGLGTSGTFVGVGRYLRQGRGRTWN